MSSIVKKRALLSYVIYLKLVVLITTSFFFLSPVQAQKIKPAPSLKKITLKMEVSGDIKANYDFSGGLGSKIKATENTNSPCQAEALFREVTRQNLAEVEVWIEFLCLQSEQEVKLKAHRFFINKKDLLQNQSLKVQLKYFTHQIKIIDLLISDLKLSDNKKK